MEAFATWLFWLSIIGMVFVFQGEPDIWDLSQERIKAELLEGKDGR